MESNQENDLPIVRTFISERYKDYNIRQKGNYYFIFRNNTVMDDNIFSSVFKASLYLIRNY